MCAYKFINITMSSFSIAYLYVVELTTWLNDLSGSSSLENIDSDSLSNPVALYIGVRPREISPIHVGMSVGSDIFQVLFRQPY